MVSLKDRRMVLLGFAGCVLSTLPGCKAAIPVLARLPWKKIITIIISILTNGSAVATMYGEDADGKEQKLEITLTSEQLREAQENGSVTVELADGTKKNMTPKIERAK